MRCSRIPTVGIEDQHVDLVLIRLADICFSGVFSNTHSRCTGPTGAFCFN